MTETDQTWAFTCVEEGGANLSLDPKDNGNYATINGVRTLLGSKYGVSANDLVLMMKPKIPTAKDMANLTQEAAEANFNVQYVNALRALEMPPGFLCMNTDFAYNAGLYEGGRVLQTAIGLPTAAIDGWVGNNTLAALKQAVASTAWAPTLTVSAPDAIKCVQAAVGAQADGIIGQKTLIAVGQCKAPMAVSLLALIASDQVQAYQSFVQYPDYGKGWTARSWRRLALSLKIALAA